MKLFNNILFICLGLFLYSCSSSQDVSTEESEITISELKDKVNSSSFLNSIDAEGEVAIDSPEFSNSGSLTVSIRKPDSVYIKLEGPFGIDVADILMARNTFVYYNVMDSRVIKGPSTPLNIGAIIRAQLTFDEVLNAFSGSFNIAEEFDTSTVIKSSGGLYELTLSQLEGNKKIWIDAKNFYVTKYTAYDRLNEIILEIEYSDFRSSSAGFSPYSIAVTRPKERQNIYVNYSDKSFPKGKLNYKLKIPSSVETINWN